MKYKFSSLLIAFNLIACNEFSDPTPTDGGVSVQGSSDGGQDMSPFPDMSSPINHPVVLGDGGSTSHCGDQGQDKCKLEEACRSHSDCESEACNYLEKCVENKSCVNYLGGGTCGSGEVGEPGSKHESCCRSLPVVGYVDQSHPGKTVFVEKYEITAGRVRSFVDAVIKEEGKPDFKSWVKKHRPAVWNTDWENFLPTDYEGGTIVIPRLLAGDPRHDGQTPEQAGPGVILPPDTDPTINLGLNHQFGGTMFVDTHGNNCQVFQGSYGFPTYYYPPEALLKNSEVPRPNGFMNDGTIIKAQQVLDVKSMNCAPNYMFQLFCDWDGGELATTEVMDFITDASSDRPLTESGCGLQHSNHGDLLGNITTTSVFTGGTCPDAYGGGVNLFFDAGEALPVPGSFLNTNFYNYPNLASTTSDKSWIVAAPGRMVGDIIKSHTVGDGWNDVAGNLTETVLETVNGQFTGKFSLRNQGIGFGSERSDLNVTLMPGENILRVQRPEAKSGLVGSRCVRFK